MWLLTLFLACAGKAPADTTSSGDESAAEGGGTEGGGTEGGGTEGGGEGADDGLLADVLEVSTWGDPGAYNFSATVLSPDTGCDRYADWWEVLTPDGALVYRRTLDHSHPDEQPFTRSGGPVEVAADEDLVVRAHLAPGGYGGAVLRGSVSGGFVTATGDVAASDFAADLEAADPQPTPCAF